MSSHTPLMRAAIMGDSKAVMENLQHVMRQDADGWTALMYAAREGKVDCVALLLTAEGGMQDNQGWTALMYSIKNRHLKCIEALLEEALICDCFGRSALIVAVQMGFVEAIPHLIQCATMCLTKPCDGMPCGSTALMFAARLGNVEAIQLLESYELGLRDCDGHTAFWHMLKGYLTQPLRIDIFLKLISLLCVEEGELDDGVVCRHNRAKEEPAPITRNLVDIDDLNCLREENNLLVDVISGLQRELDVWYGLETRRPSSQKIERLLLQGENAKRI
ncbi:Ankyrin repeat protein 1 [Giardia muris]|uniref:Ankyrin repeat protein 1 n=1 Tax=Giardia muris TaxID=5742 RepID=A0A4Z1SQ69_GIAMU|nr:Ankyrin repeat protein 1 [Giardia muris]|eukprot:TNJ27992.1 Ankyrin repeat protein 1 [Giardia muris]